MESIVQVPPATTGPAPVSPMGVSIVAIMRNEATILDRFFSSIKKNFPPGTEVIIVDTGSTDNGVEIATKNGAKVIEVGEKFSMKLDAMAVMYINMRVGEDVVKVGDRIFFFDRARNEVSKHASNEWLLSLDIAQVINKMNVFGLKNLIESTDPEVAGFSYTIHLNGISFESRRLYRKSLASWKYPVHELIVENPGKKINSTDVIEVQHIRKPGDTKAYIPMLAYAYFLWEKESSGDEARMLFYFARELFYHKYFKGARKHFEICYSRTDNWIKERSASAVFWAETFIEGKDPDWKERRREGYLRAIRIFSLWREPLIKLADLCYHEEDWVGMIGYATQAMRIKEQGMPPAHPEAQNYYTTEPHRLKYLGLVRLALSQENCGIDVSNLVDEYTLIESKTGCVEQVFILGWEIGFRTYLKKDKKKASEFFLKLHAQDPKRWETQKALLM